MKAPVIIDLETKKTFREAKDHKNLGISMFGMYNYADQREYGFEESEINSVFSLLENASYVIGFNINSFDLPVFQAYYPGKVEHFRTFDLLDDVKNQIGRRLSLNDLVWGTLNKTKSGHGLMAVEYYRKGEIDKLKAYCLDDVRLTKELFEYGVRHGEIHYFDERGKASIPVNWKKYMEKSNDGSAPLTLPF